MLQRLKKLNLYTKLGLGTVHKYSHQNLFVKICRLPEPTKVFLRHKHHISDAHLWEGSSGSGPLPFLDTVEIVPSNS